MSKMNCGYVRVSTMQDSQKDSPEHQKSFIIERAAMMGITIDAIYEDRDTATSIVARSDVQKLIEDAKDGKIGVLFFASLSRFSRDLLDAVSLKRILVNALKIRVVSLEDNYDSGIKDDELLFGIKSVVNQNTSSDISVASRRGLRKSAEAGNFIGSIAPYGYRKVTIEGRKTLEIVPDNAEIVKQIFINYNHNGMGEKAIVSELNKKGIPSSKGGLWGITSIQRILQNENYTGYNTYGRHTTEVDYKDLNDLLNRGKKLIQKPKNEWQKSDKPTHPAIISVEDYERAQQLRLVRGGGVRGGARNFNNVFAQIAKCGECGSSIVSMSGGKNGKYRYLICSRRRRMGESGCSNGKWYSYQSTTDDILSQITEYVKVLVERYEKSSIELNTGNRVRSTDKKRKELEKQIDTNRKLLFELRKQNMTGQIDDSQFNFEKKIYEEEIQKSEKAIEYMNAVEATQLSNDELIKTAKEAITALDTKLDNRNNVDHVRKYLTNLVEYIKMYEDGTVDISLVMT